MHTIENTLFIGKQIIPLDEVDSTNRYSLDLLSKSKPPEGSIVIARYQSNGRGQMNKTWQSHAGKNLTFSLILYPSFLPLAHQFALSQSLSLAIIDTLQVFIPNGLSLKWPNDIYVKNKKIGGMLLQSSIRNGRLQYTVAGMGININQEDFSSDLPNPISLKQIIGQDSSLPQLLSLLCEKIEKRYLLLRSLPLEALTEEYLQHLYLYMEDALYKSTDGTVFTGRITGLEDDGKLRIAHSQGEEAFAMNEIEYLLVDVY